jgi:hypothetical protein
MNSILEAFFVGLYSAKIALVLYLFDLKKNIYLFFFLTGFLKHFLGYYLGLQSYYCNKGNACIRVLENGKQEEERKSYKTKHMESFPMILESILEGWAYVSLGVLLSKVFAKREIISCFLIGFVLHVLFEIMGLHETFCKMRCEEKRG